MAKRLPWISLSLALCLLAFMVHETLAAPGFDADCEPFNPDGSINKSCECSEYSQDRTYCWAGMDYLAARLTNIIQIGLLSFQKSLAQIYWFAARLVAGVAEAMMSGDFWSDMRDQLLTQLRTVMGGESGVLAQLIGGNAGIFYLALLLAGFLMTFPMMGDMRLVKIERVLSWGAVLVALFISGAAGFDLIDGIERLRIEMMRVVAGSQDFGSLIDLIAIPMQATLDEAHTIDVNDPLTLPVDYETDYFKEITSNDYEPVRVLLSEIGTTFLDLIVRGELLDENTLVQRQQEASNGMARVVIGLCAAYVLALFGLIFALLTAASLVLILFFVAVLPLGFFEFGGEILMGVVRQYVAVVALSLFSGLLVRFLVGVVATVLQSDLSLAGVSAFLAALVVVTIALLFAVKRSWGVLDGSFGIFQSTIATVGAAASTSGPLGGAIQAAEGAVGTTVTTAAAVGVGAVTGGVGAALIAGAGSMLSGTRLGHTAASVATMAAPDSTEAQMFASAAYSNSAPGAAMGLIAISRRRDRQEADKQARSDAGQEHAQADLDHGFMGGAQYESRQTNPTWGGAVDMGQYLTPDLTALQEAENAYFKLKDAPAAHAALERTFGSRGLANEVLGTYEQEGEDGARRVQVIVEIAQAAAHDVTERGYAVYDEQGGLARPFGEAVRQNLQRAGLYGADQGQAVLTGRLVGACIRQRVDVWEDPRAAHKLAQDTQNPADAEVHVGDSSAQYRMHDLAQRQGWGQTELAEIFAAYPQAQQEAAQVSKPLEDQLYETIRQKPQLHSTDDKDLREAARLTVLIAADAQVQRPAEVRLEVPPLQASAVEAEAPARPESSIQPEVVAGTAKPVDLPTQALPSPPTVPSPEPAAAKQPLTSSEPAEAVDLQIPDIPLPPAEELSPPSSVPDPESGAAVLLQKPLEPARAKPLAAVELTEPVDLPLQETPTKDAVIPLIPAAQVEADQPLPAQPVPPAPNKALPQTQAFKGKIVPHPPQPRKDA